MLVDANYSIDQVKETSSGFTASLSLVDSLNLYEYDLPKLSLQVVTSPSIVYLRIGDIADGEWEVPREVINSWPSHQYPSSTLHYQTSFENDKISISKNGNVLFETFGPGTNPSGDPEGLVYEGTQFRRIRLKLQSSQNKGVNPNYYGFGERVDTFRLNPVGGRYVLFNRDNSDNPELNQYGTHSVLYHVLSGEKEGTASGVFFLNSNAQEVVLNGDIVTYTAIGGALEVFFLIGPTFYDVQRQFVSLVGPPDLPPLWSLGWQQSRYGYETVQSLIDVYNNFTALSLPLEVVWNDIDYMEAHKDFTYDPVKYDFTLVKNFVDLLHSEGRKYVVILDPCLKVDVNYKPYTDLLGTGAYLKMNNEPFQAVLWPGISIFPDFSHPQGSKYWSRQFRDFISRYGIHPDGLWIDMNEISLNDGAVCNNTSPLERPVFNPLASPLNKMTPCMECNTYHGKVYYTHSLYSYFQAKETRNALLAASPNTRPFVLTRSSFAGSGRYTAHWLGDNYSTWQSLRSSIAGMMNFNLFGIPLVGSDICGHERSTSEQLCTRWNQLGAFYPFARNHNTHSAKPQEPYVFSKKHVDNLRSVVGVRYSLIPYLYTQFFFASTEYTPVIRSLIYEYSNDEMCSFIENQFFYGPSLMVTPILMEDAVHGSFYFPLVDTFYDFYTFKKVATTNGFFDVHCDIYDNTPVFVRGGSIVPVQDPALVLRDQFGNDYDLIVAPDSKGSASDRLIIDDGISMDTLQTGNYTLIVFSWSNGSTLQIKSSINNFHVKSQWNMIHILDSNQPKVVSVNSKPFTLFKYNQEMRVINLDISSLEMTVDSSMIIQISEY